MSDPNYKLARNVEKNMPRLVWLIGLSAGSDLEGRPVTRKVATAIPGQGSAQVAGQ